MKKTRFSESKIVGLLKEYEAGREVTDICRSEVSLRASTYCGLYQSRRPLYQKYQMVGDYQKFRRELEASGLSQKAFGAQRGISTSMVSYYLKRARLESASKKPISFPIDRMKSIVRWRNLENTA